MKSLQIITVPLLQGFKSTDAIYSNISLSFDFLKPVTDFWSRKYENFFLLINKQHFCSFNFRFLSQNVDLLCQISPNIVHNWENHLEVWVIMLKFWNNNSDSWTTKLFLSVVKTNFHNKVIHHREINKSCTIVHHTIRYPYSQLRVMKKHQF